MKTRIRLTSYIEDVLIRLKVTQLELTKIQADLERLLILDQNLSLRETKRLVELKKDKEKVKKN